MKTYLKLNTVINRLVRRSIGGYAAAVIGLFPQSIIFKNVSCLWTFFYYMGRST